MEKYHKFPPLLSLCCVTTPAKLSGMRRLFYYAQGTAGVAYLCSASAAGWIHLEALSRLCQAPGLGGLQGWAQLGLWPGASACNLCVWPGLPHSMASGHSSGHRAGVAREPCGSCLALSDRVSKVTLCHFCLTLLVEAANPVLRGRDIDPALKWEK